MLVSLKEILKDATERKYAVGAFNVPNLESIRAVIAAAEELNVPVILQHAEVHENLISLCEIGPIILQYAKKAKVPVCCHLDHGTSFYLCMEAIRLGFTSIMYDASDANFFDNIKATKEIVKIAHSVDVSVEAELGHVFTSSIGGAEGKSATDVDSYNSIEDCYTNPKDAKFFVEETGVDALAISFGTTHGVYLKEPVLDFDRISLIKEATTIPLVMHGGSGVSDEDFKIAINNGITKINYYTYSSLAGGNSIKDYLNKSLPQDKVFFHHMSLLATDAIKENVKSAMKVFYSNIL